MKIKVSELIGPALDWAVAKALYGDRFVHYRTWLETENEYWKGRDCSFAEVNEYRILSADFDGVTTAHIQHYSTDWAQGGPIGEREKIDSNYYDVGDDRFAGGLWVATQHKGFERLNEQCGPTELVAKMRCYVASKLGDEVEIPEDLL